MVSMMPHTFSPPRATVSACADTMWQVTVTTECLNQGSFKFICIIFTYPRIGIIQLIHHYYFTLVWVALRSWSIWIVRAWKFEIWGTLTLKKSEIKWKQKRHIYSETTDITLTYIEEERLGEIDANKKYRRRKGKKKLASHLADEFVWRGSSTGAEGLVKRQMLLTDKKERRLWSHDLT